MIVRDWEGGQLLLIQQSAHAGQTGEFGRHWGNGDVPAPEPREPLARAATEHHRGWNAVDDEPRINPATRRPYQFHKAPLPDLLPSFTRAIKELAAGDPYVGLVTSIHAAHLRGRSFEDVPGLPQREYDEQTQEVVRSDLAEHEELQARLWKELERSATYQVYSDRAHFLDNYHRFEAWDGLSLHVLTKPISDGLSRPVSLRDGAGTIRFRRLGDWEIGLTPYPFDEAPLITPVPGFLIPDRDYQSDAELLAEWARAERVTIQVVFSPG